MKLKRHAAVGTLGRIPMFLDPLGRNYSHVAELIGLCDARLTRANYHRFRLEEK